MTTFLRERIVESAKVEYHRSTADWPYARLLAFRARDDQDFRRRLIGSGYHYAVASFDDQPSFFIQNNNAGAHGGARGSGAGRGGWGGNRRGNGRRGW